MPITVNGNTVQGTASADIIDISSGIYPLNAVDIDGWDGNDILTGDHRNNHITGGSGNDIIRGGGGGDTISDSSGVLDADGQDGNDTLYIGNGIDGENQAYNQASGVAHGGSGDDDLYLFSSSTINNLRLDLYGDQGDDSFHIERYITYTGVSGDNTPVSFYGGIGVDTVFYDGDVGSVYINLGNINLGSDAYVRFYQQGVYQDVRLFGFENASGGNGNDNIHGNDGANILNGNDGIDVLSGYGGNDQLHGGAGNDQLYGGAGDDIIYYDAADDPSRVQGGTGIDTLIVEDGIVPTSFNLVDSQFERAEVRFTDTLSNEWWSSRIEYYDSQWRKLNQRFVSDDGSTVETTYDVSNENWWSYISDHRNNQGILTNQSGAGDDGSIFSKSFDYAEGANVDGIADWLREYTYYFRSVSDQQNGRVLNVEGFADDGRKFTQTNDIDNNQAWSHSTNWYKSDGVTLDFLEIRWDNGQTQIWPY